MRRGLGIGIALLLALPAAAAAQEQEGTLVAQSGETRVLAERTSDGDLCFRLEHPGGSTGDCTERVPPTEALVSADGRAAGGAVPAEVARVEVEWRDGTRTAIDPAAHPAFDGVRWFAAEHPRSSAWLVRQLAADGALLAVTQEGPGPVVGGPFPLAAGRDPGNGRRWSVRAWLERTLARGPGLPDRTEVVACVERRTSGSTATSCVPDAPPLVEPIAGDVFPTGSNVLGEAGRHRLVLAALVAPAVGAVEVVLGDGRRVRARVREIGGGGMTARVATYVVPYRSAVRRLVVRDRRGSVLSRQDVMQAPGFLGGDGIGSLHAERPPLPGPGEVAAGPVKDGEGVLRVHEIAGRLCASVEGAYAPGIPCGLVPETPEQSLLTGGGTAHHAVFGGVVPPEVATVVLEERGLGDGPELPPVRVATQAPAPYAGAFAPHVRTFVALLEHGGYVRVRMLDADDRELLVFEAEAFRHAGGTWKPRWRTRLRAGRVRLVADRGDISCAYVLDSGGLRHQTCAFGEPGQVEVHVVCRAAASVVTLAARGRPGARLRTASGRVLRPRRLRLDEQARLVFVVAAPDAPRTLTWRGGRIRFGRVPSPRRQCGYKLDKYR